jgi:uncharacterized membrane protein HdeD (DUF308 family)
MDRHPQNQCLIIFETAFSILALVATVGCFLLGAKGIVTRSLPLTKGRQLEGWICVVIGIVLCVAGIVFSALFLVALNMDI